MADAVVIGSGPNGLVAGNLLADRGWEVTVLEEAPSPGGAVRSGELIEPGFVNDLFSAFYPFALASPHVDLLELDRWGLEWHTGGVPVAHPRPDGGCSVISLDLDETAASLDESAPGDGDAWRDLYELWERARPGALSAFFGRSLPAGAGLRLLRGLGPAELLRLMRFVLLPVRRMGEEVFAGEGGRLLLAGNALHADVGPDAALSGLFGWVLCSLAQQHGFPVVAGGAGQLTRALVSRLEATGGEVLCDRRVRKIECRGARATAVVAGDARYQAHRAVIADVGAPQLYRDLLPADLVPARVRRDLERFQYDNGTFKVDWTLDAPIPWRAPGARRAGTVHIADSVDALTRYSSELACGELPANPYLVMGQYAAIDGSRAPEGKETAWAYTHVPQHVKGDAGGRLAGTWDERESGVFADRIEEQVERLAPGFRSLIRGRHVFTPPGLEAANRNLVGGALGGGTAQLHQQLVFRPVPTLAAAETPIARLYLGSASVHPGGGVHGGPGANAAAAALAADRRWRPRLLSRASVALMR